MQRMQNFTCSCQAAEDHCGGRTAQRCTGLLQNPVNNSSVSFTTNSFPPKGAGKFTRAQQWGDFASQSQTCSSAARPKSDNHTEPRTKQQRRARPGPTLHQMCRGERKKKQGGKDSSVHMQAGPIPGLGSCIYPLFPVSLERKGRSIAALVKVETGMWSSERGNWSPSLTGLREPFI